MHISKASKHCGRMRARHPKFLRAAAAWCLAAQLAFLPVATAGGDTLASAATPAPTPVSANDPVLRAMQTELARAVAELAKSEQPPYYLGYTVYDQDFVVLAGAYGSVFGSNNVHRRFADVTMRVGSPDLDNTHGQSRSSGMTSGSLPLQDDPDATARILWQLTDREYKRAAPAYLNVKTNQAVQAEEEDKSPDFSKEDPSVHLDEKAAALGFDQKAWEERVRRVSGAFRKYGNVYYATVILQVGRSNSRMVSTEGAQIETPSASARLVIEAQTRADDGMDLLRVETFQAPAANGLPPEAQLMAKTQKMAADLEALRKAPVAEPYDGPALLSGRAAAVFFHEVLGHRLEGHRQRDEEEGQT